MLTMALLVTALLFGGMILYSFGFAAFIFYVLPPKDAGPVIRQAFPHFYLFVLATSVVGAALVAPARPLLGIVLALIAVTVLIARQVLMPAINRATDSQDRSRFKLLHGLSVAITLAHIGAAGWVLVQLGA